MEILKKIIVYVMAITSLFVWSQSYHGNELSLLILFIWLFFIVSNDLTYKIRKKECYADYFFNSGFINNVLKKRLLMYVITPLFSVVSILFLSSFIVFLSPEFYIYLLIDSITLMAIYNYFKYKFKKSSKPGVLLLFSKHSAITLNVFIMTILFFYFQLNMPIPEVSKLGFEEIRVSLSAIEYSRSGITAEFLYIFDLINSYSWWLMVNFNIYVQDLNLKYFAWLLFLIQNGIVFSAFSKLILEPMFLYEQSVVNNEK